jgi:hypothetical protein
MPLAFIAETMFVSAKRLFSMSALATLTMSVVVHVAGRRRDGLGENRHV